MASTNISYEETANIEKLVDAESFQMWKFQIEILCKAHGLYEIVTGELKYNEDGTAQEKADWTKKDARAQNAIVTSVDKKVLMHVINCQTSTEMYKKLCSVYQKDGEQQKCSLLQEFFNIKYEKGSDISLHISKLENLAFRLKALGQEIDNEMLISKILSTLPENYKHFRTAWESTPVAERTLTNLTLRLLAEEAMNKNNESEKSLTFNTSERLCYKCNKPGHLGRF